MNRKMLLSIRLAFVSWSSRIEVTFSVLTLQYLMLLIHAHSFVRDMLENYRGSWLQLTL